jgi:photolyase PhrII
MQAWRRAVSSQDLSSQRSFTVMAMLDLGWPAALPRLPSYLEERCRWLRSVEGPPAGRYLLYWMHHALRLEDNPALDVARALSLSLDLPLLIYQGLSERYPYASDRHHAFIVQGARDVQRLADAEGLAYAFFLASHGQRSHTLRDLAQHAALVITEEMPVEPVAGWLDRLARGPSPLVAVDASCLVPMRSVDRLHTRAFEFRQATEREFAARVSEGWPSHRIACTAYRGELPFAPLDLAQADLSELIGQCEIDHTIAPVADTPGGQIAGMQRWRQFVESGGLDTYAARRNDASDNGVSRMSAYLHYGMVSPFRIARDADAAGAEKFLDELLIWRELSFNFCFHRPDHDSWEALPAWAQDSLEQHAGDPRTDQCSWERLARGQSDDRLWNAFQRSLLKHGELHNNGRMTWGKAFLSWAPRPKRALQLAIDLNHRYALDGRAPGSYGGVLWCFGQFDRPFQPEQPIYGSVRPRPTEVHLQRLEIERLEQRIDRPIAEAMPRVAVIGAGLGGLMAARILRDHGLSVRVLEKSRGVGGRLATRRADEQRCFDHGAQYFTARDPRFQRYVCSWLEEGLVQPWTGRIVQLRDGVVQAEKSETARYVGVPTMNGLAKRLARDLEIQFESRVARIFREGSRWRIAGENETDLGDFEIVLINAPPAQAAALLPDDHPLMSAVRSAELLPCWAVMAAWNQSLELPFAGAFVERGPLAWIARDNSKPGRLATGDCWVLHAESHWSRERIDWSPQEVVGPLLAAFAAEVGIRELPPPHLIASHRWRYARPSPPIDQSHLWDRSTGIGLCGDWCGGPRVEGAALSGMALAGAVLRQVTIGPERPVG